jgi:hypothetical protein
MNAEARTTQIDSGATHLDGWAAFAAVLLTVAGVFNVVNGFTALHNADYYTSQIVYSNLTFWGWAFLIWGALEVIAGVMVFAGMPAGRVLGVFLAMIAAMLWFFMIFSEPWAAVLGVTASFLVLYGLTAAARRDVY